MQGAAEHRSERILMRDRGAQKATQQMGRMGAGDPSTLPGRAAPQRIESADNGLVRRLRRLGVKREPGVVLLEGPRVVRGALACGLRLEVLALGEGVRFDAPAERTVILGERAMAAASQTVTPQGVLAVARSETVPVAEAVQAARGALWPLLVLDGVQDPGNVGTICRSAAAAGAPALAVLDGGADPFGAKAVRASAGTVFRLKIARGRWEDLAELSGYAASAAGGVPLESAELEQGALLALGGETHGVRRQDLTPVTIPMAPGVESLNVAGAAAILLFELRRRRTAGAPSLDPVPAAEE